MKQKRRDATQLQIVRFVVTILLGIGGGVFFAVGVALSQGLIANMIVSAIASIVCMYCVYQYIFNRGSLNEEKD